MWIAHIISITSSPVVIEKYSFTIVTEVLNYLSHLHPQSKDNRNTTKGREFVNTFYLKGLLYLKELKSMAEDNEK